MRVTLALLVLTVIAPAFILGYPSYKGRVPNGAIIRDPCDGMTIWKGMGHQAVGGRGPLNPFGLDFINNAKVWNQTLCEMDSDGDGTSNGAELGDPDCVWAEGSTPAGTPTGHPGVCEPMSDPLCVQKNTFHTCQTPTLECDAINSTDVLDLAVRLPVTNVPATESTDMCMNVALPADQDYHVIADRGLIDNRFVVHHVMLYACPTDVEVNNFVNPLNTPYACGTAGEVQCQDMIALWAVGITGFCHNENAGFRIGPTGYKYATLQVHWTNPVLRNDYTDSSGISLYYTPVLRTYNLGNLMTGEKEFRIPPGESQYVIESECSSTCSSRIMTSPIYFTSGISHMHYMGTAMTTFHTPAGGVEHAIMDDNHYSYGSPEVHTFQTPLEISPGDVLRTACSFTSSSKHVTTFSGQAASQETCYALLVYYPKESMTSSQCTTWMGLPACSIDHESDLIDGCQLKSFFANQSYLADISTELPKRCESFNCRKECKTYIAELRHNPCFQGKVKAYVESVLSTHIGVNETALYHSCDAELALEAAEPCTCTTQTPTPCVEYTGAAESPQMSLYPFLLVIATIYSM